MNAYIAAISMSYLLKSIFSVPAYGEPGAMGTLAFSIILIMSITGGIAIIGGARAIKYAQKLAVIGLVILSVWITTVALRTFSLSDIMAWEPSESVRIPFGSAVDGIIALGISWVMAVADYTRYTDTKKTAVIAPMAGASFGMFWFSLVGTLSVIAVAVSTGVFDPELADPASVASMLGLGQVANILIIISTIAVNLINVYSAGFSTSNFTDKLKPRNSMAMITVVSTVLAFIPLFMGSFLDLFQVFLGFIGAVFPPFIAIMIVDYYILRKGNYQMEYLGKEDGPYWYTGGVNWPAMAVWFLGAGSYFLALRVDFIMNTVGAVFVCFVFTATAYVVYSLQLRVYS